MFADRIGFAVVVNGKGLCCARPPWHTREKAEQWVRETFCRPVNYEIKLVKCREQVQA